MRSFQSVNLELVTIRSYSRYKSERAGRSSISRQLQTERNCHVWRMKCKPKTRPLVYLADEMLSLYSSLGLDLARDVAEMRSPAVKSCARIDILRSHDERLGTNELHKPLQTCLAIDTAG